MTSLTQVPSLILLKPNQIVDLPKLNQVVMLPKLNQIVLLLKPTQIVLLPKPNQVVLLPNPNQIYLLLKCLLMHFHNQNSDYTILVPQTGKFVCHLNE